MPAMPARKVTSIEKARRKTRPRKKQTKAQLAKEKAAAELQQEKGITEPPPPPDWLDTWANKYWKRIVPELIDAGVLTTMNLEGVEVLCLLYGNIKQASMAHMPVNAAVITQFRLLAADFGVLGEAKYGDGNGTRKSKFDANRKKKT
jgi:phage terminase small subunit